MWIWRTSGLWISQGPFSIFQEFLQQRARRHLWVEYKPQPLHQDVLTVHRLRNNLNFSCLGVFCYFRYPKLFQISHLYFALRFSKMSGFSIWIREVLKIKDRSQSKEDNENRKFLLFFCILKISNSIINQSGHGVRSCAGIAFESSANPSFYLSMQKHFMI